VARDILIAVTEKLDQEELKEILGQTDFRLIFADNGEDALQQIRFFKPSLVVAETALSEKSGLEICKAMKADRELRHIPCVLLKGVLEELPRREVEQAQAYGVISKPLHRDEVLKLVQRLRDEGTMGKKEESLLEDLENLEEGEVIELVDVVEEPEGRLNIDDFLAPEKEEVATKMAPLESWDKQIGKEEKPLEEELGLVLEGLKKGEAEVKAKPEAKARPEAKTQPTAEPKVQEKAKAVPPSSQASGQGAPKGDFLEKVALEDIFLKVEKLKPIIEKELAGEGGKPQEEDLSLQEGPPSGEAGAEKPFSLEEFEAALHREVSIEPGEETLPPLAKVEDEEGLEEEVTKRDVLKGGVSGVPPGMPVREEKAELAAIEKDLEALLEKEKEAEVPEGISPKAFQLEEEAVGMEELEKALHPFMEQETIKETAGEGSPPEVVLEEEELKDLLEEELPEVEFGEELKEEELPRDFLDELAEAGEIRAAEEPSPGKVESLGEPEPPTLFEEERGGTGAPGVGERDLLKEMEEKLFEEEPVAGVRAEPERVLEMEEMETSVLPEEEVLTVERAEEEEELPEEAGPVEEAPPVVRAQDKQVEEILAKGVQVMMEDFVRKVVPEITQNLLNVTMERIESMVKEVVPEIAEKAIKEEIRKIQEGDKE
jgi:CheY-like chemotaxis protein